MQLRFLRKNLSGTSQLHHMHLRPLAHPKMLHEVVKEVCEGQLK